MLVRRDNRTVAGVCLDDRGVRHVRVDLVVLLLKAVLENHFSKRLREGLVGIMALPEVTIDQVCNLCESQNTLPPRDLTLREEGLARVRGNTELQRLHCLFRHDLADVKGVAHDIGLLEEALGRIHGNDTIIQAEDWLLVLESPLHVCKNICRVFLRKER